MLQALGTRMPHWKLKMGLAEARASIMMTARLMVRRVTPPMNAPAPMSANAPGSTQDQGLGGRNTPGGALQGAGSHTSSQQPYVCTAGTRPGAPCGRQWRIHYTSRLMTATILIYIHIGLWLHHGQTSLPRWSRGRHG